MYDCYKAIHNLKVRAEHETEENARYTNRVVDLHRFNAVCGSGSGMGKKSGSGSGMNNLDHVSERLKAILLVKILKFFDPDPGWKEFGSEISIPDPQH
jgi:hypothetical protein